MALNNPLICILDAHQLKSAKNYSNLLINLIIVLDSKKLRYIIDQKMPKSVSDKAISVELETY